MRDYIIFRLLLMVFSPNITKVWNAPSDDNVIIIAQIFSAVNGSTEKRKKQDSFSLECCHGQYLTAF